MKRILLFSLLVLFAACSKNESPNGNRPPVSQKPVEIPSKQIVFSSSDIFAFLDLDGTVVSWDDDHFKRTDIQMPSPLNDVKSIVANSGAIAALKKDGSVVAWGDSKAGADLSAVQSQLTNVTKIVGNRDAFAALKSDGSVVTWGSDLLDGDGSTKFPEQFSGKPSKFKDLYVIDETLYGPREDGTCLRMGFSDHDPSGTDVLNVKQIAAAHDAKAILSENGTVTNFGWFKFSDDSRPRNNQTFFDIEFVAATSQAFAAIKKDGSIVSWGDPKSTNFSRIQDDLKSDVVQLAAAGATGFAAMKKDGSVYVWGALMDARKIIDSGAKKIYSNSGAFAILKDDGSVVAYGNEEYGGKSPDHSYGDIASLVTDIAVTSRSFAALRSNGEVVIWGNHYFTKDSLKPFKRDVISIEAYSTTYGSYLARKRDGSVAIVGDLGIQGEKYIK